MTAPIVHADPAARRRAILIVLVVAAAGAAVVAATTAELGAEHSSEALQRWLLATIGGAVMVTLASGIPLLLLARQILTTDHFPPPGRRVIRDTPLRSGRPARRIAWLAIVAALSLWVCAGALSLLALRILRSLPI
jgi:hypothetical protein